MLKTNVIALMRAALSKLGVHFEQSISGSQIAEFLKAIQPIGTEHELIRVGSSGDGGYLIPNDLTDVDWLFSPGVSNNASFEAALVAKGITAFLCDGSIENCPIENSELRFTKKFLGVIDSESSMNLKSWVDSSIGLSQSDSILQMDIEGAEYECLLSTPLSTLRRFRIIVVEFHGLDLIGSHLGFRLISRTFQHLGVDFQIVHVHANNCRSPINLSGLTVYPVIEVTFLRNNRIKCPTRSIAGPHPLDADNVPSVTKTKASPARTNRLVRRNRH